MSNAPDNVKPLRSVARPKQARSEDSLRRLLDAAESLLEERRFGEISIADIARRARSSVGGFYARFRDKDELLLALHERFVRELDAQVDTLEAGLDPRAQLGDLLRPALHLLVDIYRARRGLLLAFTSRAAENRRLFKAGLAFRNAVIARFTQLLLRWRSELKHPDPELAAELSVQLALGFMEQSLSIGRLQVGGEPLPEGRVEEELERALSAYLDVTLAT